MQKILPGTMLKKRKSSYTILFFRIVAVVILVYLTMAGVQFHKINALEKEYEKNILNNSKNEVAGLMDLWIDVLTSVNDIFSVGMENAMFRIADLYPGPNPDTAALYRHLEHVLPDTTDFHIRIIRYGSLADTVAPPDSDVELYASGREFKDSLIRNIEEWDWRREPLTIEPGSKRFKCRGYLYTGNKQNVIGIEFYSETADTLLARVKRRMEKTAGENKQILAVNLYCGDKLGHFGLLEDAGFMGGHDSLVSRTFLTGSAVSAHVPEKRRMLAAYYGYLETPPGLRVYPGNAVFSIVTDLTGRRTVLFDFVKVQAIILLASVILLAMLMVLATRKLRITLKDLLMKTTAITAGNLHERVIVTGQNEFTTLAEQFNSMVESLESSQKEMKQRNKLIENKSSKLKEQNEEILSQRDEIQTQRDEIERQRDLVLDQRDKIQAQKKAMSDSIHYAVRIQKAILPPDEVINYLFPKHFILYKPKDVISGDFYWLTHINKEIIFAVADCTGHGVPGAFMSMLGSSLLNEVVRGLPRLKANLILNELRDRLILSLRQTGHKDEANDGMDIALGIFNKDTMKLQFAGANNSLYLVRNGKLKEYTADKMPIGISPRAGKSFTNQEFKVQKEDTIYLFSDGFADQFGGEHNKKYRSSGFKNFLLSIQDNIMYDQKLILEQNINEWMGWTGQYSRQDQVDDITVMGIKF